MKCMTDRTVSQRKVPGKHGAASTLRVSVNVH